MKRNGSSWDSFWHICISWHNQVVEYMSITLFDSLLQYMLTSKEQAFEIPALLRVRLWLGRLGDSPQFMKCCEGRILVFAETVRKSRQFHQQKSPIDPVLVVV